MTPLARTWLRRIALGLPMVAVPLASPLLLGVSICGPCPTSTETHSFAITEAQAARILDAEGQPIVMECRTVCTELVEATGTTVGDGSLPDGAVAADAGLGPTPARSTASSCEVVSVGDMLEARCHWTVTQFCGGRRPEGLTGAPPPARTAGAWLARMAWMEAASVDAFVELAEELAGFGAPEVLVRAARDAAEDERLHALVIGSLAQARGAQPMAPSRTPVARRSLEALALDNAIEGGVRETYGALLAGHQATYAQDADVRRVMGAIARDEARHAMLSDRIDAWARSRVDGALLDRARIEAAHALARSLEPECEEPDARALGLPALDLQRALILALA